MSRPTAIRRGRELLDVRAPDRVRALLVELLAVDAADVVRLEHLGIEHRADATAPPQPPRRCLDLTHGTEAGDRPLRRSRGLDGPRRRHRSRGRPPARQPLLRRTSRAASWRTAAPSRSSPATPSWPRSACRSRTRTTPSAPSAPRCRIVPAVEELGLSVRIGVESGEVVVEDAESTFATGEAVNLAARLQQAAPEGGILIGPGVLRLANGRVVAEPAEPVPIARRRRAAPELEARATSSRRRERAARRGAVRRPRGRARNSSRTRSRARSATAARISSPSSASRASARAASSTSSSKASSGRRSSRPLAPLRRGRHVLGARRDGRSSPPGSPTTTRSARRSTSCARAARATRSPICSRPRRD